MHTFSSVSAPARNDDAVPDRIAAEDRLELLLGRLIEERGLFDEAPSKPPAVDQSLYQGHPHLLVLVQ